MAEGVREIPVEERSPKEVTEVYETRDGEVLRVRVVSPGSPAANPGFDVAPARLVSGLVAERSVAEASAAGSARLFPEQARA